MATPVANFKETPEEIAYELRAAEGAAWIGSRSLIGVGAFIYASLAFAYFYLRSANQAQLWRPHHVTAPTELGVAIFALSAATAALSMYGAYRFRRGSVVDWEVAGWMGLLLGALGFALQIYELTRLPFYPGSSGYASTFVGWGALNLVGLLGGCYWLETLLARSLRLRRAVAEDGGAANSTLPAARLFRASVEGCTVFWGFLAIVAVCFWALFYLV